MTAGVKVLRICSFSSSLTSNGWIVSGRGAKLFLGGSRTHTKKAFGTRLTNLNPTAKNTEFLNVFPFGFFKVAAFAVVPHAYAAQETILTRFSPEFNSIFGLILTEKGVNIGVRESLDMLTRFLSYFMWYQNNPNGTILSHCRQRKAHNLANGII